MTSCKANTGQQSKADNMDINNANSNMTDYFKFRANRAADKRTSQVLTQTIYDEFSEAFFGNLVFSLLIKDCSCLYQGPLRRGVHMLQKPLKEELNRLIILPLAVDVTMEWCNHFILVPKDNGKVQMCLGLAILIMH